MKRMKLKIFFTIFLILNIFVIGLLLFSNIREYNREKYEIERVLERSNKTVKELDFSMLADFQQTSRKEIFIDYKVYTFELDDDGNYVGLIKAMFNADDDPTKVVNFAKKITSMKKGNKEEINIIFNKYSYSINNNILTVVDNSYQTERMNNYITLSFIIFILSEIVSFIIANNLTKWITKPVIESFERERKFIGDASHELKTPIAVIMASADAYSQDKNNKWLDNIKSESDRMSKLVKELLDLNQLENNTKEFKKEKTNFSKLVESSLLPYESLFFENNLKFDYDIKENIFLEVNEDKIKELISILIDNAIKYSKEKGHVKLSLYIDKDICLKVSNKGDEIPLEDRDKIFDRFYKVDKSRNRKSNNYGLGLSIAKKIVELHSGEISVDCKKGTTTFTVKF